MKIKYLALALSVCFATGVSRADDKKELKEPKEKVSYGLGFNLGSNLKRQGSEASDFDLETMIQGMRDAMAGKESLLTPEQNREAMTTFQNETKERREKLRKELAEKNKKEGDAFLAENKAKPGVITAPDGLQYKIIKEGTGPKPTTNDVVTVNYVGHLVDGKEFDSSYKRGQPATFQVNRVIKGWTQALQMMPVGSKWEVVIPPSLAYGDRGSGTIIGPDAVLVFEVELLSIKEPEKTAASTGPHQVTSDIIKVPSAEELKKGAKIEIIKPDQLEKEKQK